MAIFTLPRSTQTNAFQDPVGSLITAGTNAHANHPSFGHLVLLVFEAVLEVVCVSLPGYIAAQQGMFDAEAQKLVANLNVTLFTPCLSRRPCDRLYRASR
jgi:Predicted permeases